MKRFSPYVNVIGLLLIVPVMMLGEKIAALFRSKK
jgi:hypothetical protein